MNDLSWFIYLADVAPQFAGNLLGVSLIFFVVNLMAFISVIISEIDGDYHVRKQARPLIYRLGGCLLTLLFLILSASAIPSSPSTYYAIAASEMGEQALKTPTVHKGLKALEAWLDKQIESPKAKDNDNAK